MRAAIVTSIFLLWASSNAARADDTAWSTDYGKYQPLFPYRAANTAGDPFMIVSDTHGEIVIAHTDHHTMMVASKDQELLDLMTAVLSDQPLPPCGKVIAVTIVKPMHAETWQWITCENGTHLHLEPAAPTDDDDARPTDI